MKYRAWAVAVVCLAVSASSARGQSEYPPVEVRHAGPYQLTIALSDHLLHVGRALQLVVWVAPSGTSLRGAVITAVGVPAFGTHSIPTQAITMQHHPRELDTYVGEISFPVRGAWDLEIRVVGVASDAKTRIPITVTAPVDIPIWLGWLIGLSPLVGVAWFARWQFGYLRRLYREQGRESS